MILIIDNYDSFTYNLYKQIETLGGRTKVFYHDKISVEQVKELKPSSIVISPGPKGPSDSGVSMAVIKKFFTKIPILGVCIGHQCIGQVFGAKIIGAKEIVHGKTSKIFHTGERLFKGLPMPFFAARYHSLCIDRVPPEFDLTAWTKNKEIMAIQHKRYPLFGVQFHPESFMTKEGNKLMKNFLNE